MYFLGIDPSATSTGYAILDASGKLKAVGTTHTKKEKGGKRLSCLRDTILQQLKIYAPIQKAVVEAPAYHASMGADLLGQVRGIFLLLLFDLNIETVLVAPTAVKKFATHYGNSNKDAMIEEAQKYWPTWVPGKAKEDEADALWMAEIARGCMFPKGMTRAQLEVIHQLKQLKTDED